MSLRTSVQVLACTLSFPLSAAILDITDFGATPGDYSDDDAIAINLAIDAANVGDVVSVPAGKFHLRTPIVMKSDVSLKGVSYQESELATLYYGDDTYLIYANGVSDVAIENLRLKSNSASQGVESLVYVKNATNVTIRGSSLHRFIRHGVYFNNTVNGRVDESRFLDATETDLGGHGYGVVFTNGCNAGRVDDSQFIGPKIRHGVVIQGNKVDWNPSHDIMIKNNYFENNVQDSIDLHGYGEYNNYVIYNTIEGDPDSDVIGRGIGVGEDVHGPSGTGNVIQYNVINNTRYGIHILTGSEDVTVKYNTISNCKRYGIYVQDGSDLDIRDNTITGCQKWGVYVKEGDDITLRSASQNGNQINQNGLQGSAYGGVRFDAGVTGLNVQNNNFCDNDASGGVNLSSEGTGIIADNLCQ
ncbi:periplasmic copper-binding pectate lyase superfamily protein [Oleiphilus messinensis]|uniref:Periplasmic copper-binding pectate lyase superfamily protein n=1 Tax=Oleiphilus messinensis TaxID=141451 RepID=A0A1Y0I776_9GAMM|nr:right-handed parallel beta-helix repeat-containing protein [Oleiphilus messinensis]ARU55365.1 periplasmic copper-binding pectate lyase superfamily protein [Oleiphilus messinensis]